MTCSSPFFWITPVPGRAGVWVLVQQMPDSDKWRDGRAKIYVVNYFTSPIGALKEMCRRAAEQGWCIPEDAK